jgi:hypothetical protein
MNRELVLAALTFAAGYCWCLSRHHMKVSQIKFERDLLYQVSGELCDDCGWAMKFPDEPCRCELLAEVEELRKKAKSI